MSTIAKHALLRPGSEQVAEVGRRIRRLRVDAGLTQARVGGPFSAAYVSAIEHGKVVPSLPALVFLALRLGVDPADLLAGVKFGLPEGYNAGHETCDEPRDERSDHPS
jgi:transcriptional regulator with XRE-family HTH domain